MNISIPIILLRLIHITAGAFWVGSVAALSVFIMPAVRAVGPAAAPVMKEMTQVRKMPKRLLLSGLITWIAGVALYGHDSAVGNGSFEGSHFGITLGIGAIIATLTILMGIFVNIPTAKKLTELSGVLAARGGAPTAEEGAQLKALQDKLAFVAKIATAALMTTVALMAVARYV